MNRVFVYGTLRSDGDAHRFMGKSEKVGEARTTSSFYLLDMGSHPSMHRADPPIGNGVWGEVYLCDDATLAKLDEYECVKQNLFERIEVELDDGTTAQCYLYVSRQSLSRGHLTPIIEDGKWDGICNKWC